ncbi:helix-turn-helix domain-containing protein [Sphingobacterium bovisgrunnientis]|jgi:AraC-like DNA-binding protein|uniref:helix-turn-helix domain-containing protein n=1 Tax=Sphingobacterium bovisgrunnientis TaxID=1874697 RepID=UPI0013578AD9|nr:AraC family transcriptional regulator [Sphingobacterium bovisgrunnientis]
MPILYIKNMVCNRCIMVVEHELGKANILDAQVKLGEVILAKEPTDEQIQQFTKRIESLGFERIDDKKSRLVAQIKNQIIKLVHYDDNHSKTNLSESVSSLLHQDYSYLSNLFSEIEGTTVEKYYIAQKIEKVKELLVYDELSLSEIADRLNYSSVGYLSNQFKKITGLSPSQFKQIRVDKRKPLDEV